MYAPGPIFTPAAERIAGSYTKAVSRSPDQPVFVLGDFTRCDVSKQLPTLHQSVSCPLGFVCASGIFLMRMSSSSSSCAAPPPWTIGPQCGSSIPIYCQKLKQEPPQVRTVKHWTPDSAETLRGYFEASDWNVFFDSCGSDQDALTDTITSYITYCEDPIIPTKEVRIYPNNKPWIGKDFKQ